MSRVRWTTEAADDLEAAVTYIRQDNPDAAQRLAQMLIDRIERLSMFPGTGRMGEVSGTRELVASSYVIVYRLTGDAVEILHIWHGAQDWR